MRTRDEVIAEAQGYALDLPGLHLPDGIRIRNAFIAGRTVGRERYVEAARKTGISTYEAREFLYAAGLLIEGHQP